MFTIKETIYTIPVMEALEDSCECALCAMHNALEKNSIDFMMGPSVAYMEDTIRMQTNETGFCPTHFQQLYSSQNRLGLALIVQTHMQQINRDLAALTKDASALGTKKGLFAKGKPESKLSAYINKIEGSCYTCTMIANTFERYVDTFFILFGDEPEVQKLVKDGKGFCLKHFACLMDIAPDKLSAANCKLFCDIVVPIQMENMKRLEDEVEWFTKKFDYRFQEEPWKNAKDSVERAIEKIASVTVKE